MTQPELPWGRRKGKKRVRFSFEEKWLIEKMLKEGATLKEMSKALNRRSSTVSNEIQKTGGRAVYTAKRSEERRARSAKNMGRKVSEETEQQIHQLFQQGASIVQIRLLTGLSHDTITARRPKDYVRPNPGGHYKPHLDLRPQSPPETQEQKMATDSEDLLLERVEALEMQIEIITEELRKLHGTRS